MIDIQRLNALHAATEPVGEYDWERAIDTAWPVIAVRLARLELIAARLVETYRLRPCEVAAALDETIDRTGNLLGWVRTLEAETKKAGGIMSEQELIARQAMKLERLEAENEQLRFSILRARRHITCIGGPLNDNSLGYSKEQLSTFRMIESELGG